MTEQLGSGGFGHVFKANNRQNEVHVLSDGYKQSSVKHTADVVQYMSPEGQTTEYNHLIDVYSLALIGAKIFGFDSDDIRDGIFVLFVKHLTKVMMISKN
ncbi:unnamed protein product [Medioppia subpectinata]|uniref:Protein kinase domain-containing protein n=1 Tax=Medioppia subpectinata TaxID=1979941 RepID=A0A7R9KH62_9ACAR|nr:unnamed protein product [Medioppia subpectinata]CAG2103344.1 unnamed protein product [Medioppia subpectinata]